MSYVAPEVLLDHKYTSAADIYSFGYFGVIMAEMTTGIPLFYGFSLNIDLALKICKGTRPDFAIETPNCYIELARLCMHSDSQKRPTAKTIHSKLSECRFINTHDISQKYHKEKSDQLNVIDEIASDPVDFKIP
ncbi:kinase-like domain-containing protein [Gigaspora rosea]|uniref:non-specific serine/threonine protein kinase n=1 Tax=Gigaspora rosea TaxID=44941 RepID=A0A397VK24_9GLOM|nr:kinase-like domain-containing protein [Gigaspora rosea]